MRANSWLGLSLASSLTLTSCSSGTDGGDAAVVVATDATTAMLGTDPRPGPSAVVSSVPQAGLAGGPLLYQGPRGLATANEASGQFTPLFKAGGSGLHADWSPDGARIVYAVDADDGTRDLWTADAHGAQAQLLFDCAAPCVSSDEPAWGPNGERIVFVRVDATDDVGNGVSILSSIDVASIAVTPIIVAPLAGNFGTPRWNHDGGAVVVELTRFATARLDDSTVVGATIGLVHVDADAPAFEPIVEESLHARYPDWSPRDDLIVFMAGDPPAVWDTISNAASNLYTVKPDGSDLLQITDFTPDEPVVWMPAFSADGASIIATSTIRKTRDNSIVVLRLDGSTVTPLAISGAHARQSP